MSTEKTKFTCPDCGGAIEKITEGNLVQYRCRIGHLYSPGTAIAVHAEREENTLWTGVVVLEEGAELAEEAVRMSGDGNGEGLREIAKTKRQLANRLREIVLEFAKLSQTTRA